MDNAAIETTGNSCNKKAIEMNLCNKISIQMMLKSLRTSKIEENIVSSPVLINLLLNMLVVGSEPESIGQVELMDALGSKSVDEINCVCSILMILMNTSSKEIAGPILSMTNRVWTDFKIPIKPRFHEIANKIYRDDKIRSVDLAKKLEQVVRDVNAWTENHTKGLVRDLISGGSCSLDNVLYLADTLYFKAAWKHPFKKSMTCEKNFYLLNGETVKVPFMTSIYTYFYRSFDGFKVLKLPYQSGDYETKKLSIYIVLPDEVNGLETLLKKIDSDPSLVRTKCEELEPRLLSTICIPKFKITFDMKRSDILKQMESHLPNTMNMVDSMEKNGRVPHIIQKSCIEVNEEGTEGASETSGGWLACEGKPPRRVNFLVDHPFFFVIKEERTGVTLFDGTVCNPLLS